MKRYLFLLFLLLICRYSIGQQYIRLSDGSPIIPNSHNMISPTRTVEDVKDGILVTYEFNYVSKNIDHLFPSTSILYFEGFGIRESSEEPALPIKWDTFYVPTEIDYSVNIVDSSYIELPIEIAPARQPMENGSRFTYTSDNVLPIRPYEGLFPQYTINTILNTYRRFPILDISINPIRYNYHQKRVVICKKISYLITFRGEKDSKNTIYNTKFDADPMLNNIVMNPRKQSVNRESYQLCSATQITTPKYLIITVPQFSEAVNKLADWKRTLGYNVEIISQNAWDENSVKSAVIASNRLGTISYLLIFGDFGDIPGKYITRSVYTSDGYKTYQFYTDYYYGCIQQDSYPEIHRGRISASTQTEANVIVDKIINYERRPISDSSFYSTALHCAYFQDDNYYNNGTLVKARDSIEDRRFTLTSEEIRNHIIQQGKTINRIYCTPSSVTPMYWKKGDYGMASMTPIPNELLKSNEFLWNGNSQDISNGINNGALYVLHRDHGNVTQWGNPSFSNTQIGQLNNGNKLPIVFSMNCLTGRYHQGTCFAEAFLRKADGGCAGIFAATETSFSGYNDALALAMFEAIWPNPSFIRPFPSDTTAISYTSTPIYKLGVFLDQGLSKIHTIYPGGSNNIVLHTKEIFHCFGDPAMEMYTDVPTPFTNVSITKSNGNTIVSLEEDATITFFNRTTGTIESYYGNGITYPNDNNIQVCISAHNKIPYIKEAGCLYIQNETISDTSTYHADQIKVGSNVNSFKPSGPVTVMSGKTMLIGDAIELDGETTINLGASLEIKNQ